MTLSQEVLATIGEVLARRKFARFLTPDRRAELVERIGGDCRDAKDNRCLELALAAGAEVIESSDEGLLVLDPLRGVRILRPAVFLAEGR